MMSFPRLIQSSWQSNWQESNCADYSPQTWVWPRFTKVLRHCPQLSSAHMHCDWYPWSHNSKSDQTKFTFRGTRGTENYTASYLKKPACAFSIAPFFQLSWKQALPQPLGEPGEPSHLAAMLVSGIWEEHQLKKWESKKRSEHSLLLTP